MITRSPSLTDQVKAHLKERIVSGAFEEGRIPSEIELANELGVSRTTIRDALSRLENEGSIYRKQGAGTFVNEPGLQIKSRLEEMWSYEEVLRDHGFTPSIRVVAVTSEPAAEPLAADLEIEPGEQLLVVEKVFLEDDLPVALTYNRVPARLVSGEIAEVEGALPLYDLLDRHCDRQLSYYLSEIVPVALPTHEAAELGVPRRTPALSFEEIGFDQNNDPVAQSTSFFRDDLLRFRLIRRKAGA
ncbi:MAG TPA: GntR family transcriptional regulator [Acidimicrobiia bacterium]|nr:GntR family transcriptional regulator [Acidimicrobiia bacterium]